MSNLDLALGRTPSTQEARLAAIEEALTAGSVNKIGEIVETSGAVVPGTFTIGATLTPRRRAEIIGQPTQPIHPFRGDGA